LNIVTELPLWFLPLCLLTGAVYGLILYFRERRSELSALIRRVSLVLRFLSVSLIAFLLLSPLILTTSRELEKPIIIIAHDNSKSIVQNADSAYFRNEFMDELRAVEEDLAGDYEVLTYHFSESVKDGLNTTFSGMETDISALFEDLSVRYANRNVGALILASDGIYNRGSNPLYPAEAASYPVYTIALGDTAVRKDLILNQVNYNKVCYLGNTFPLEINVLADKCKGSSSTLSVSKGGQVLFSKTLSISDDDYIETVGLTLDAHQAGLQHYRVTLSSLPGEITTVNNSKDIYVDVLDGRQKILILAGAPHPDVSALRQSLEGNSHYDVEVVVASEFNKSMDAYNLIIFHQIPFRGLPMPAGISSVDDLRVPALFILGSGSDISRFNGLRTGVQVLQTQGRVEEVQAVANPAFSLFSVSDAMRSVIPEAPPLLVPYGEYKTTASVVPLFYQKVGNVGTQRPLLAFNTATEQKTGIICGEGVWRWRLYNYMRTGNHQAFAELTAKVVQYLAIRTDKSLFRLNGKNRYSENEAVKMEAELYNESYELNNEPEVRMVITDQNNRSFSYVFSRTSVAYSLNAGILPVGDYRYTAQVRSGNRLMQESGEFSVEPLFAEFIRLRADHRLLNSISVRHDGEMVFPSDISRIPAMIRSRDDIKTIAYSQQKYSDMVNLPWVMLLIFALLGAEWFLRKRGGAY
jgi:hypothetical protein